VTRQALGAQAGGSCGESASPRSHEAVADSPTRRNSSARPSLAPPQRHTNLIPVDTLVISLPCRNAMHSRALSREEFLPYDARGEGGKTNVPHNYNLHTAKAESYAFALAGDNAIFVEIKPYEPGYS
jgi:hypothetical protein